MKEGHVIIVIVFLLLILVLSFNKKNDQTTDVNGNVIEYEEPIYVDGTSNLITKAGHYLSILVETTFEYVFIIINKIISFLLGICRFVNPLAVNFLNFF